MIIDGQPQLACLVLPIEVQGSKIETVEGLSENSKLHPLQKAFVELGAAQCGYCTPGMLMKAKALLEVENNLNPEDIREALAGNLCRCTGYQKIVEAVQKASTEISVVCEKAYG